ncbi:MAG TPA: DUF6311 domain-containing protein, partial [Spirochaetota bacterium]|nr:DUF6311 domain-containing protein [Spirochaetota bacterium]
MILLKFLDKIKSHITSMTDFQIQNKKNKIIMVFICGLLGVLAFITIFGIKVLDVTYIDWITDGFDLQQHYFGWSFFRNDTWHFPLGKTINYGYPFGISVVYTDSIPLFAIFFKLFKGILPEQFQYFGIFSLMCFI